MPFLDPKRVASGLRRLPLSGRPARLVDRLATRVHRLEARRAHGHVDDELGEIVRQRLRTLVPVDQPLVLISQIHRSGGTLLMRLFDGHPEVYAIPHELGPLLPSRAVPGDTRAAWRLLHDPKLGGRFKRGIHQQSRELNRDESEAPFLLVPSVHRLLFSRGLQARHDTSERSVLNAYLTAYFNAWLDYRGKLDEGKRWVTGFESAMIAQPKRMERFRELYPDGRVISVVREPSAWFASARRWDPRFERLDIALELWRESTESAEALADELPGSVLLLDFDDLVAHTAETMAEVARFLGIEMRDELLVPTVNGVPFGANSSFESTPAGRVEPRVGRSDLLSDVERQQVEETVGEVYRRVRQRCLLLSA